jgi:hypothetical protein
MTFLLACARWFRHRPRSGVLLALVTAVVVLLLSRSWPRADPAVVGAIAVLSATLAMILPAAIHEAHGRWLLRPRCWEQDGQWWVEIDPRWTESFRATCVVTDELGGSALNRFAQPGGRAPLRFPEHFEGVEGMKAGSAQPRGRYIVHWTVKQAGNTFDASGAFVWR